MSEPTWTTMHIGGALPLNRIEELIEAIDGDFYEMAGDCSIGAVKAAADEAASMCVQGQVNHGNPQGVIAFCRANGLPYWLHFDAGYEWDSGIQIWKPGNEKEDECPASAQGYTPTVDLSTLRIWAKAGLTLQHIIDNVARFESGAVPPLTPSSAMSTRCRGQRTPTSGSSNWKCSDD